MDQIIYQTVTAWLEAFEDAKSLGHTTTVYDDASTRTLGWHDVTADKVHSIKLEVAKEVHTREPHLKGTLGWLQAMVDRVTHFYHKPAQPVAPAIPDPTDPDLLDALELLRECGGKMAYRNNPRSKDLIDGGWAIEGDPDHLFQRTLALVA